MDMIISNQNKIFHMKPGRKDNFRAFQNFQAVPVLFTARKRSLGQGNMFTGVCLSTGGCLLQEGGAWSGGCLLGGVPPPGGASSEGPAPGWGCLLPGGCLLWGSGLGGAWWRSP